jgi:isoleucyl-tRNA synthetase
MKFKSGARRKAIEYEKDLVSYWKKHKTFEKSVSSRPKDSSYVFYDGPPFLTGTPHHGHLLGSIVKDAVGRYWTMQGRRVERVWGWDCHGLPAEVFTEKKLGIEDRRDIGTKISLEKYITTCRDNMVQTSTLWEDTIDRIGRWVEFKGAYKTMDKEYMESVWWAFKRLYEKGKIYEGEKVLMYCTRDATPVSKAEISMDNSYQDDVDPSVYVKFKLEDGRYLVAWTTTPWTLPSNSAIAVNKAIKYREVIYNNESLIIADNLVEQVMIDERHQPLEYKKGEQISGKDLVGMTYRQPFDLKFEGNNAKNACKIWHADFVSDEEGTGIAHESPAYGEDDYILAKENDIPWIMSTDESGVFTLGPWKGKNVWDTNKQIAKELLAKGVVFKIDYITHSYPHCWRCGTKLMYRAVPSWFMDIDGQKKEMLQQNGDNVNWHPKHIKHGRFEKTIQSAPDWNLSRNRFWATPIPVWKGTDEKGKEHCVVVGSYKELAGLSGKTLDDYHRPWVDDITFEKDGIKYERITEVIDCWFESGSMPFAQFHYPFVMHAVGVGLFDQVSFKNVVVTGTIAGNDGRKMSKSLNNFTDPNELMDKYSADALRLLLLSSSLLNGEDFALVDKDVADVNRKLAMIWNVYDFFTMYAEVDNWEWDGNLSDPTNDCTNVLDKWILSKLHTLINDVGNATEKYDLQSASRYILPFVDDLSNWYVRRSRKRFWKSEDDQDKQFAYRTLHYVLVQLAHVLAPFTPFLADELFMKMTGQESVHLNDWPEVGHVNERVVLEMDAVRSVVNEGLSQRSRAQIKTRQPLQKITVIGAEDLGENKAMYLDVLKEELNIKEVDWNTDTDRSYEVMIDTTINAALKEEGIAREVVRAVQQSRKVAGLEVDDRIELHITVTDTDIQSAIKAHKDYIIAETLTLDNKLSLEKPQKITDFHLETCRVLKSEAEIYLRKVDG